MDGKTRWAEFVILLRREWREDWGFLLVTSLLLTIGGSIKHPPSALELALQLTCLAAGLVLGVRAYAPDSANGTARFIQALPVGGRTVLAAKLCWRVLAIGLAALTIPYSSLLGATVLVACLVGMVSGWLLEQPTTAFAAGATVLVALGQAKVSAVAYGASVAVLAAGLAATCLVLLGILRWLVGRQ